MAIPWILTDSLSHLYSNVPIQPPFLMPPALHFYGTPNCGNENFVARCPADLLASSPFLVVILFLTILRCPALQESLCKCLCDPYEPNPRLICSQTFISPEGASCPLSTAIFLLFRMTSWKN